MSKKPMTVCFVLRADDKEGRVHILLVSRGRTSRRRLRVRAKSIAKSMGVRCPRFMGVFHTSSPVAAEADAHVEVMA